MDSYNEESSNNMLEMKKAELEKAKEELKQAKDKATQSWLDSRPLLDELEKLKSGLVKARDQAANSSSVISELEYQLKTINLDIKSRKEEEFNSVLKIDKLNQSLDELKAEIEQVKLEKDEECRQRSEIQVVQKLRRQTLRALQLTLRAIRLESEALGTSAAAAVQYVNKSKRTDDAGIQLTQEDYYSLTRRVNEETSLADWRVSLSVNQRLAAQESRDSALRRLEELTSDKRSIYKIKRITTGKENAEREAEKGQINAEEMIFPKGKAKEISGVTQRKYPQQQLRRPKRKSNKKIVKKKKSVFVRVRTFLLCKIGRLFK